LPLQRMLRVIHLPFLRSGPADGMARVLFHATYGNKAKAIQMVGFRVGPLTKPGTAYKKVDGVEEDPVRAEAFVRSEAMLAEARPKEIPTRWRAVFFATEGSAWADEPGAFKTGDEDEFGRSVYDFGFGKDVLFVVDSSQIPCRCGVGDNAKSDEVFACQLKRIQGGRWRYEGDSVWQKMPTEGECRGLAGEFWKTAMIYEPGAYEDTQAWNPQTGEALHEMPEVWCPCSIPKEAIIDRYDKRNPPLGSWDSDSLAFVER